MCFIVGVIEKTIGVIIVLIMVVSGGCMIGLAYAVQNFLGSYFDLDYIVPLLLFSGLASIAAGICAMTGLFNCCYGRVFLFVTVFFIAFVITSEITYMLKVHKSKENTNEYLVKNASSMFMGDMSGFNSDTTMIIKWTTLQATHNCCGIYKPSDWTDSGVAIPYSCCKDFKTESIPELFKNREEKDPKALLELVSQSKCDVTKEDQVKTKGCFVILDEILTQGIRMLKMGVLVLLLFQLLASGFFIYLLVRRTCSRVIPAAAT